MAPGAHVREPHTSRAVEQGSAIGCLLPRAIVNELLGPWRCVRSTNQFIWGRGTPGRGAGSVVRADQLWAKAAWLGCVGPWRSGAFSWTARASHQATGRPLSGLDTPWARDGYLPQLPPPALERALRLRSAGYYDRLELRCGDRTPLRSCLGRNEGRCVAGETRIWASGGGSGVRPERRTELERRGHLALDGVRNRVYEQWPAPRRSGQLDHAGSDVHRSRRRAARSATAAARSP